MSHAPSEPADRVRAILTESARVEQASAALLAEAVAQAAAWIAETYRGGGKVLLFGNGGSAADAQHIAAEWTGRLLRERDPLPAIALPTNSAELTALGNDYGFERIYARLVAAHGRPGDIAVAISTSGSSANVVAGVAVARQHDLRTIGLLGRGGGKLASQVDLPLIVPSDDTQRIQESHITIANAIAELVDDLLLAGAGAP